MERKIVDASSRYMFSKTTYKFLQNNVTPETTHLDISSNHLDENCAKIIASFLRNKDFSIHSLCVEQCHLNHKSSCIIFDAVGESKLFEFYVDDNLLDSDCCRSLGASLSKDPPLELLSVVGCQINDLASAELFNGIRKNTHLRHLRIDSNSILANGANSLGHLFPGFNVESLSVSDNQIWDEGTRYLLEHLRFCSTIKSLDIGYNIVDLDVLSEFVKEHENLEQLCISGCKVKEDQFINFINVLCESNISRLLIDDISFSILPISWECFHDNAMNIYYDSFLKLLVSSEFLVDVRIGFLSQSTIHKLQNDIKNLNKNIIISMHDFGHTRNTWLLHLPEFKIESPTNTFRWNNISEDINGQYLANIYNLSSFKTQKLKILDFKSLKFDDISISDFLDNIEPVSFSFVDFTGCEFRANSAQSLINYLKKEGAYIEKLTIVKTRLGIIAIQNLLEFFNVNIEKTPISLKLQFESKDYEYSDSILHDYSKSICNIITQNCNLEELYLDGLFCSLDVVEIIKNLKSNNKLRKLEIESDLFKKYDSPDPDLQESQINSYIKLTESLYDALFNEESVCVLESFVFPLLTEIYLYSNDKISEKYSKIITKLQNNSKKNKNRK